MIEERFKPLIHKINQNILIITRSNRELVNLAVNDLVQGGGKRLRPILAILAGRYGNFQESKMLKIAASLEILHMASLIHDDIIDDADLRRGRASAQTRFGKKNAVFVGDFLLAKAYNIFANLISRNSLNKLNKSVQLICEGEISQYEDKYDLDLSITDYLRRIRRKTALLFGLSTYIGAYESGIRGSLLGGLYNLGLKMGMAFQIQDDILDFIGDHHKTGKGIGSDLKTGIYTLPIIYLLEDKKLEKEARSILEKKVLSNTDLKRINELIKIGQVIEKSREMGKKYIDKAYNYLNKLPENSAGQDLEFIVDYQLKRKG